MGKTTEVNTKSDELNKNERPLRPKPTLINPKMNLFHSCGLWFWCNELIKNERPQNLGFVYCTQTKKSSSVPVPGLPHTHCKVFQILMNLIEN